MEVEILADTQEKKEANPPADAVLAERQNGGDSESSPVHVQLKRRISNGDNLLEDVDMESKKSKIVEPDEEVPLPAAEPEKVEEAKVENEEAPPPPSAPVVKEPKAEEEKMQVEETISEEKTETVEQIPDQKSVPIPEAEKPVEKLPADIQKEQDDLEAQLECIVEGKPPKISREEVKDDSVIDLDTTVDDSAVIDESAIDLNDSVTVESKETEQNKITTEEKVTEEEEKKEEVKEEPQVTAIQEVEKVEEPPVVVEEKKTEEIVPEKDLSKSEDPPEPPIEKETVKTTEKVDSVHDVSEDKSEHITTTPRISEIILNNGSSSTPNSNNATKVNITGTPIKNDSDKTPMDISSLEEADEPMSISEEKSSEETDENLKAFKENIKQMNGLTSDSGPSSEEVEEKIVPEIVEERKVPEKVAPVGEKAKALAPELASPSAVVKPSEAIYETNLQFEGNLLQILAVHRVDQQQQPHEGESPDASVEKSSSNGSTISLGPFQLPVLSRTATQLSTSSNSSGAKAMNPMTTTIVKGASGLRKFFQDLLKRIPDDVKEVKEETTPVAKRGTARGRGAAKKDAVEEVKETKAVEKKEKEVKSVPEKSTTEANVSSKVGNCVLARWSDKKYYAGRITAEKPGNKYVVHFEDGANKTMVPDHIVFGEKNVLPILLNQEVNVLVEANIYETGLVVSIDSQKCTYNVVTDTRTVTASATDLYLDEDQAKVVQSLAEQKEPTAGASKEGATVAAAGETTPTMGTRRKRGATDQLNKSAEAGCSSQLENSSKKSRKRPLWNPNPPQIQPSETQFSDLSDTFEESTLPPKSPEVSFLEAVDGVEPELINCPNQTKIKLTCRIYGNDIGVDNVEEVLGPLSMSDSLFKSKHFLLTCPVFNRTRGGPNYNNNNSINGNGTGQNGGEVEGQDSLLRHHKFSNVPFIMEHLTKQLISGGGIVYSHFEDIPSSKYKFCYLISPEPCLTARFIQCLSLNFPIVSHEWVIDSCRQNSLMDIRSYFLPAGWSILEEKYVRWGPSGTARTGQRSVYPLMNRTMLISSENEDFIKFWSRVCKFAGGKIKVIKTVMDISANKRSFLLTDSELCSLNNIEKAKAVNIPIVSTLWVLECLVLGKLCAPDAHENLTKSNFDLFYS